VQRRGRLEDRGLADVLRAAAAEGLSGSVEVEADVGGTVYLDGGAVSFALVAGTGLPMPAHGTANRDHIVASVSVLLGARTGWYHHHQFHQEGGRPPIVPTFRLPVSGVLEAAAERARLDRDLGEWRTAVVRPARRRSEPPALDAELWSVVTAMAIPTPAAVLAQRLGWAPGQVADALERLASLAVIDGSDAASTSAPVPSTSSSAPVDLTPRPLGIPSRSIAAPAIDDRLALLIAEPAGRRRSALGRLIENLRS
jgi:hypothetical protein